MSLGYYPGCALRGTSKEYDISLRKGNDALGVPMPEVDDWNCCGASAGHMTHHKLTIALNVRNLALAEAQGFDDILAPCPLCSKALIAAQQEVKEKPALKDEILSIIEMPYEGKVQVLNYLQVVEKYYREILPGKVKHVFGNLKAACYYGCVLVRPPKLLQFDDAERPTSMEGIVNLLGFQTVDWAMKVECCGGGLTLSRADIVVKLCRDLLRDAKAAGADFIVAACPMCHANLDLRQSGIAKRYEERYGMPIVYLSELIGIAIGMRPADLPFEKHLVTVSLFR